jgi:hypothetical protein
MIKTIKIKELKTFFEKNNLKINFRNRWGFTLYRKFKNKEEINDDSLISFTKLEKYLKDLFVIYDMDKYIKDYIICGKDEILGPFYQGIYSYRENFFKEGFTNKWMRDLEPSSNDLSDHSLIKNEYNNLNFDDNPNIKGGRKKGYIFNSEKTPLIMDYFDSVYFPMSGETYYRSSLNEANSPQRISNYLLSEKDKKQSENIVEDSNFKSLDLFYDSQETYYVLSRSIFIIYEDIEISDFSYKCASIKDKLLLSFLYRHEKNDYRRTHGAARYLWSNKNLNEIERKELEEKDALFIDNLNEKDAEFCISIEEMQLAFLGLIHVKENNMNFSYSPESLRVLGIAVLKNKLSSFITTISFIKFWVNWFGPDVSCSLSKPYEKFPTEKDIMDFNDEYLFWLLGCNLYSLRKLLGGYALVLNEDYVGLYAFQLYSEYFPSLLDSFYSESREFEWLNKAITVYLEEEIKDKEIWLKGEGRFFYIK